MRTQRRDWVPSMLVPVIILEPSVEVGSMAEVVRDGAVKPVVEEIIEVYSAIAENGEVRVIRYAGNLNGATRRAVDLTASQGPSLVVLITDYYADNRTRVQELIEAFTAQGNFLVLTPVSEGGNDQSWAEHLLDELTRPAQIDIIPVGDFGNPEPSFAKVGKWLNELEESERPV
jgi:hypothetical protein